MKKDFMKRVLSLIFALLFLAVMLTSCAGREKADGTPALAVIETSEKKSYLNFYSADMELLSSTDVDKPMLGEYTAPAVYSDGKVFVIGEIKNKKTTFETVMMIDVKDGSVTELPLSFSSIYSMCVFENCVYTITGINYVSALTRYDVSSGEKKEFKLDGFGMNFVYVYDDTVFLVDADTSGTPHATLYLLDVQTFEVKEVYDVKNYFYSVNDMLVSDGVLYIAPLTRLDKNGKEIFVSNLVCFDFDKKEFREIAIKSEYPCKDILKCKEGLVIANTNPVLLEGQGLTVYNFNSDELTTKTVAEPTIDIQCKGERLYQLSEEKISVFDLGESDFPRIKTVDSCVREGYKATTFFVF